MDMLYPDAKFGSDLPPHGGERGTMAVFYLFVCLLHRHILKVHMEFATGARFDQSQRLLHNCMSEVVFVAC